MSPEKNIAHRDLSAIDRTILKILLSPNGEMKSTVSIAKKWEFLSLQLDVDEEDLKRIF